MVRTGEIVVRLYSENDCGFDNILIRGEFDWREVDALITQVIKENTTILPDNETDWPADICDRIIKRLKSRGYTARWIRELAYGVGF